MSKVKVILVTWGMDSAKGPLRIDEGARAFDDKTPVEHREYIAPWEIKRVSRSLLEWSSERDARMARSVAGTASRALWEVSAFFREIMDCPASRLRGYGEACGFFEAHPELAPRKYEKPVGGQTHVLDDHQAVRDGLVAFLKLDASREEELVAELRDELRRRGMTWPQIRAYVAEAINPTLHAADLEDESVEALRKRCDERGIPNHGTKGQLVARLVADHDAEVYPEVAQ